MSRKRQKINNTEEMMDALVEYYFRYDELAQMEAEVIRHNITGSGQYQKIIRIGRLCPVLAELFYLYYYGSFHHIKYNNIVVN
jgi:endonuclease III